jgi:MtN3 and saliva related transmembrane protein
MNRFTEGLHHFHKIRRYKKRKKEGTVIQPVRWHGYLDHIIYFVGFVGPIMTIPQLIKVWGQHSVEGLSAVSWSAYLITAIFWLVYGLIHKEWPIIVANIIWIMVNIPIVIGIFYFE